MHKKEHMDDATATMILWPVERLLFCPQSVQGSYISRHKQNGTLGTRRKVRDFVKGNLLLFAAVLFNKAAFAI